MAQWQIFIEGTATVILTTYLAVAANANASNKVGFKRAEF
jgi:hypothetical protein